MDENKASKKEWKKEWNTRIKLNEERCILRPHSVEEYVCVQCTLYTKQNDDIVYIRNKIYHSMQCIAWHDVLGGDFWL